MGKLSLAVCLSVLFSCQAFAQVQENTDTKTIEQVMINTAIQKGVEAYHNQQVDTIKKKQEKLMGLTMSLATYKELLKLTLENAKGFGVESGIYKSIVATSIEIVSNATKATNAVMKTNLTGKAITAAKIYGLLTEAAHLGNLFFSIVTNAEVPNPLKSKMPGAEAPKKEKLNLLNRYERLDMALKIQSDLKRINHELVMVIYYCSYNSFSDLLIHLDVKTWRNYHYANFKYRDIINQWNSLSK